MERFLAKSTEKSSSILKILKEQLEKGKEKWTEEAEAGLELLKEQVRQMPMLVSPLVGEPLILYLSGGKDAVSATLIV